MNRKEGNIKLLHFIIEQYETNPNISDTRLGQLLLNAVPNESLLYHLEAKDIQERLEESLRQL